MKILIKNANIITLDNNCNYLHSKCIEIENGKIKSILNELPKDINVYEKIIDANNKIVMPSYVNAHTHFYSSFATGISGIASSNNFEEVLNNMWWRLDKKLTLEDTYYSALTTIMDGIKNGVTTFIDHHASPFSIIGSLSEIKSASMKAGVKSCLAYEVSDRDGEEICNKGITENFDFIRNGCNEDIKALIGLHASFTLSDETLSKIKNENKENFGYHIHVSEDLADEKDSIDKYSMSVVERLAKFGILSDKSILVHCVNISELDMLKISKSKAMVVHNPQSNANNAVGIGDVLGLIEKGVPVGLGTDAMTNKMGQEVRTAMWLQHLNNKNPSCGFMEVASTLFETNYNMANKLWDNYQTGKISEGYQADLILVDYNPVTPLNSDNTLGHLVFGIAEANVSTTICNGKVLWHNGKFENGIDEDKICEISRAKAHQLWERINNG